MKKDDSKSIRDDLKKCYGHIAHDFSESRKAHWPEFHFFSSFIPPGASLLDAGCGDGRFLRYLEENKKSVEYTGVDFCPELLHIAKKKFPHHHFVLSDITAFDASSTFDRIVCIALLHHIPSRKLRLQLLRNFSELLHDQGLLLFSIWNLWQGRYWKAFAKSFLKSMVPWLHHDPRDIFIPFGKGKHLRYYHAFLPWEIRSLITKAGFSIEESSISRQNFLFVCRKNLLAGAAESAFDGKKFAPGLESSSVAIFQREP